MSFFKDVYNDITRTEPITIETLQTQAKGFLVFGIAMPVLFAAHCLYTYFDDGLIRLEVIAYGKILSESSTSTLYGNFDIGNEGILQYRIQSLLDLLLLNSIEHYNLLDIAFFFYIGIVLYKGLKSINENSLFQSQLSTAFKKVGTACFLMYVLKMFYDGLLIREYFEYRTHDQFQLIEENGNVFYFTYAIFGAIIGSFGYYINKGIEIQQDNDLTI